jgi:hypothetical protein
MKRGPGLVGTNRLRAPHQNAANAPARRLRPGVERRKASASIARRASCAFAQRGHSKGGALRRSTSPRFLRARIGNDGEPRAANNRGDAAWPG